MVDNIDVNEKLDMLSFIYDDVKLYDKGLILIKKNDLIGYYDIKTDELIEPFACTITVKDNYLIYCVRDKENFTSSMSNINPVYNRLSTKYTVKLLNSNGIINVDDNTEIQETSNLNYRFILCISNIEHKIMIIDSFKSEIIYKGFGNNLKINTNEPIVFIAWTDEKGKVYGVNKDGQLGAIDELMVENVGFIKSEKSGMSKKYKFKDGTFACGISVLNAYGQLY